MVGSPIRYTACPSCGSESLRPALSAKDYTVSGTSFEIWECDHCTLRFTQDAPDPDSIKNYYRSTDYISHTNTGSGWVNRLYHLVRKQTLEDKRLILSSYTGLKKGKLLDLGAGTGAFVRHMLQKGWEVTGLEPDEGARERATSVHQATLLPTDSFYEFEENAFDAISLWHVLEHIHKLHVDIQQLKKILKPAGRIFIAVPNYTSYDARFYKGNWAAYDVPRHLYHFSPASMLQLLNRHQLRLEAIRPMWYDGFYISLLSEQYKRGRANPVGGVLIGAISNIQALFKRERCSSLIYIAGK